MTYYVTAPETPGAVPTRTRAHSLVWARKVARTYHGRRDLTNQDVRIEREDGRLVEYAGPNR